MGPDSAALKEWGGGARSGAAAFGAPKLFGMEKFYVLCITETRKMCVWLAAAEQLQNIFRLVLE